MAQHFQVIEVVEGEAPEAAMIRAFKAGYDSGVRAAMRPLAAHIEENMGNPALAEKLRKEMRDAAPYEPKVTHVTGLSPKSAGKA